MATTSRLLNEVVTFTRGTGKTRTNAAGLIVGVDFSSTSNTITTGSKTFTLAADPNVNRDWVVGSNVRAVDQVGGGAMVGTVTSYTPSTQALVINVTSVTGSGTSTNWRIGTLEITRDPVTNAVSSEPAATNLATFSEDFTNAAWVKTGGTATANTFLAPNGSTQADTLSATAANATFLQSYTALAGGYYSFDVYLARRTGTGVVEITADGTTFQSVTLTTAMQQFVVVVPSAAAGTRSFGIRIVTSGDEVYAWGADFVNGAATSYIPTTTAQVTRNADSFALTSTAISAIRQGQGTLYVEAESADVGPTQKRAIRLSGSTGDIRLAKRGVGNFSGFTKMLEVDNDLYFGVSAGNSQRCNGKEMGAITVTINERTGVADTVNNTNSWAYDGINDILYAGGGSEERLMKKNLSLWSGKGFGALTVLGGTYTGTRFVHACSTAGVVFLSNDGLTWRRRNTSVINQPQVDVNFGVIGGVSRLVSTGSNGSIFTSDDNGETWVAQTGVGTVNLFYGVFAAGLFVIARQSTTNAILTSPDGITWTARTTPGANGAIDVAHNGTNLFVAVGNNGLIITSPDAITWTQRTSGTTNNLQGVYFAAGQWVAVGNAGTILTSPDGTTWTTRTSGTANGLRVVSFFNNLFVTAGLLTVLTSPDGVTWTSRTANASSTFLGISASANRLVLAGDSGALITSEDATTYTSRTNNIVQVSGMAYGNGVFVSAGNAQGGSGYIATIDAAGNYTRRVSGVNTALRDVKFLNGAFYISLTHNGTSNIVLRSVDGISWSTISIGGALGTFISSAFGAGFYVLLGENNFAFSTSTDGLTWTARQNINNIASSGLSIAFGNGIFVAVGTGGLIYTATNPTAPANWTLRTSGTTQQLNSVMYSTRDQLWYAAGAAGTLLFSADAITWQSVQNAGFASIDNITLQSNPMLPLWVNGRNRIAVSYATNNVIASQNGVSRTDLTATIPTITAGNLAENLNGFIYRVELLPTTTSATNLNSLTTTGTLP